MKTLGQWRNELAQLALPPEPEIETTRSGKLTAKLKGVYLHSRYDPEQEAARLVESAGLDPERPVVVVGAGIGYHIAALRARGHEVTVFEPVAALFSLSLQQHPELSEIIAFSGLAEVDTSELRYIAEAFPQILVHPATARLFPDYVAEIEKRLAGASLRGQRLNVAVVGPMYGGSLPIAGYLANAFRRLGHNTLYVDNSVAWPMYEQITHGVKNTTASSQLGGMLANVLAEWSYARVVEFDPEICIALAQAPVGSNFRDRLAKGGTLSAFWYVENWRHLPYWQQVARNYDFFFHIQPGEFEKKLDEAGCAHHGFVQTACDPEVHRPVSLSEGERETYDCDISFAGAGYYNRQQFFRGLTDYNFKLWGVDWSERELVKRLVGGQRRFDNEDFMKIVAGSRINLNLHSSTASEGVDPKCDALNPRVFEIAAARGFQLCDPCQGIDAFFEPQTELPLYRNLKECRALIDHYLAHEDERAAVAAAAQEHALREHTYQHRAQQMLEHILDAHSPRLMKRGVRAQKTVGQVLERLAPDSQLAQWLQKLPKEAPFDQPILTALIHPDPRRRTHAEQIFAYMHEVRDFAETLLKEPR